MSANCDYRRYLIPIFAILALSSSDSWRSPALGDAPAPVTKGPEVSTVGTDPYVGPLPEELAKRAQLEAEAGTPPSPVKEQATETITAGGLNTLTAEEQAKLAALLATPATIPVPEMLKLELMDVSKEGTPLLTAQEREKRARELAAPPVLAPATPGAQIHAGDAAGKTAAAPVKKDAVKGDEAPATSTAPATPQPAPKSSR